MVAIKTALSKAPQEHTESEESQQGNWRFRVAGHQRKLRILKVRVTRSEQWSQQTIEHTKRQHFNQVLGELGKHALHQKGTTLGRHVRGN